MGTRPNDLDESRVSYGSEGWGFESLRARLRLWSDLRKPSDSVSLDDVARLSGGSHFLQKLLSVAAKRAHRGDSAAFGWLLPGQVRVFESDDMDDALEWLTDAQDHDD